VTKALALAAVVLVVAWMVRRAEGNRALEGATAAFGRGDRVEAIVLARAAADARCPWCAAPELGYARLEAIAKDAEAKADDATAVAAWRAVRAATLATVVVGTTSARRERAEAEIARFEHRIDATAAALGGTASPAATEERLRGALATSAVPSGSVFVLLAIGGALFLLGARRFVESRVLDKAGLALALGGGAVATVGALFF
jgi:hypothetical protein